MLKTGLIRPLMPEILDKLDECEWGMIELLIDSATEEKEVNSSIKATQQETNEELGTCPVLERERCDRKW